MKVQELAEELTATRMEFNERLDQLAESIVAIDLRLRDFPPRPPSPDPRFQIPRPPGHDPPQALKGVKMKIPFFNGNSPHNWLFKSEMFFRLQQVPEHLKIPLVGLCMDGAASEWYQWVFLSNKVATWPEFARAVKERFGASDYCDLKGMLSKLSQQGTLAAYVRDFECLINQVTEFSDDQLMSFFVSGLHSDLRRAIQLHWPTSLHQAMQLAAAYEAHHTKLRSSFTTSTKRQPLFPKPLTTSSPFSSVPGAG